MLWISRYARWCVRNGRVLPRRTQFKAKCVSSKGQSGYPVNPDAENDCIAMNLWPVTKEHHCLSLSFVMTTQTNIIRVITLVWS